MDLIYGAGQLDRIVRNADELLRAFTDDGRRYLAYRPSTPPDRLVPDDLAVTILINSRVGYRAFVSVQDRGSTVDLTRLPRVSLEQASEDQRAELANFISHVAQWPGFGCSVATKILHKKRPELVPILDNQAIFGAYMSPRWPDRPSSTDTVRDQGRIKDAVDWIAFDLTRPENVPVWRQLAALEPERSRIDLFDMVWWSYFRQVEPAGAPTKAV